MGENDNKVRLRLMGISYSPLQTGAFAMLLAQVDGPYRIPVVIGSAEAKSIAIHLEGIATPRPLTHDLFCTFAKTFCIQLVEVFIYKFEDGIFSAYLTFFDGSREVNIDSRASDAVALALRCSAPIYTTEAILKEAGTILEEKKDGDSFDEDDDSEEESTNVEDLSVEDLEQLLQKHISEENYEEAQKVSELLKKKRDEDLPS